MFYREPAPDAAQELAQRVTEAVKPALAGSCTSAWTTAEWSKEGDRGRAEGQRWPRTA